MSRDNECDTIERCISCYKVLTTENIGMYGDQCEDCENGNKGREI